MQAAGQSEGSVLLFHKPESSRQNTDFASLRNRGENNKAFQCTKQALISLHVCTVFHQLKDS